MYIRILYGALAAVVLLLFLLFQTWGFIALIYLVGLMAVYELNHALRQGGMKTNSFFGYLYIVLLVPAYLRFDLAGIFVLLGLCAYLSFIYCIIRKQVDGRVVYSSIPLIYPCLMIAFACPVLLEDRTVGFPIILLTICCCFATDIFAYFAGVFFGRHKLCPTISPKKTVEGSVGGFLGSVAVSAVMYVLTPWLLGVRLDLAFVLTTGVVCGALSQFGDLTASVIKRVCGIKDYGNLIPGHGGILDRLDSIIFCLPAVYTLMLIFWEWV